MSDLVADHTTSTTGVEQQSSIEETGKMTPSVEVLTGFESEEDLDIVLDAYQAAVTAYREALHELLDVGKEASPGDRRRLYWATLCPNLRKVQARADVAANLRTQLFALVRKQYTPYRRVLVGIYLDVYEEERVCTKLWQESYQNLELKYFPKEEMKTLKDFLAVVVPYMSIPPRSRVPLHPHDCGSVKALYDLARKDPRDLPFKKGQVIDVVAAIDKTWLMGYITHPSGRKEAGVFPRDYVVAHESKFSVPMEKAARQVRALPQKDEFLPSDEEWVLV